MMESIMKGNLKVVNKTEKDSLVLKMVKITMANIKRINRMDLEYIETKLIK
jgi:hypothetical protein